MNRAGCLLAIILEIQGKRWRRDEDLAAEAAAMLRAYQRDKEQRNVTPRLSQGCLL